MKYWIFITALLLAGCTTTNVALSPADKAAIGAGTLQIVWLLPNRAEITLDGKRYVGEWSDGRCFTPECRGEFRNVLKHHRNHIRNGAAELVAKDSSQLNCKWVSHDNEVVGTYQAEDGRTYRLRAG
jgi:hypothetical protein